MEASRQSRVCGGAANEVMCAVFRVLMEVCSVFCTPLACLILKDIACVRIMWHAYHVVTQRIQALLQCRVTP